MNLVLLPKQPRSHQGWFLPLGGSPTSVVQFFENRRLGVKVISSANDMEYQGKTVPTWHVSASITGGEDRRLTDDELAIVRADFGMEDAEEDNHSPGVARHLFRPAFLPKGTVGICECKDHEETVVEPDGHRWQREKTAPR